MEQQTRMHLHYDATAAATPSVNHATRSKTVRIKQAGKSGCLLTTLDAYLSSCVSNSGEYKLVRFLARIDNSTSAQRRAKIIHQFKSIRTFKYAELTDYSEGSLPQIFK